MEHHTLDAFPNPKDKPPLYGNEPWLIDRSMEWIMETGYMPEPLPDDDNIRIYIPMDLNKNAILRRLDYIIHHYKEANEKNEMDFSCDVVNLINQIEIYDQIWFVRHMPEEGKHSAEAIELVKEFIEYLEDIPDGCAEVFPFSTIEKLRREFIETVRDNTEPMEYDGDWF